MTTGLSIGYGAMQPSSTLCKVFAIGHITFGAYAMTLLLAVFVRKLLNLVPLIAAEEWKYRADTKIRQSTAQALLGLRSSVAPKYRVEGVLWFALFCWTLLGTMWAREWQERQNGRPQWTWMTSAFFAVGTITTAGMLGPEVDEHGKVPSASAIFLAIYAIIGVPLFGAAISHRASKYVEAQVRRQERENLCNRLSCDLVNAVRELRYGAAAARRSTRNTMMALQAAERTKLPVPDVSPRRTNVSAPNEDDCYDGVFVHAAHGNLRNATMPLLSTQETRISKPIASLKRQTNGDCKDSVTIHTTIHTRASTLDKGPLDEHRVLWGDFLALHLLRMRKVDFELLKDLREEYLETIATGDHRGLCWSMLTKRDDGEDILRQSCPFVSSDLEAHKQPRN